MTAELTSKRRWQALTAGTVLLVPAFWTLLAGIVTSAGGIERQGGAPNPYAALAFGLAIVPFVFIVVAIVSSHPRWPGAVLAAMGLALVVGGPVSAFANDVVTGFVVGVGLGAAVTLRAGDDVSMRARAIAVLVAAAYAFLLVRMAGAIALLSIPVFPLTAVGFADELTLWWRARAPSRAPAESDA